MGSPVSPIVANLYMEYLEQKTLSTAPHPPRFWCRYVDDTFVIHKEANKQGFLQHINIVDPAIKFTVEDSKEDGSIPFLDTIVKPEVDGSLSITVYRKPTHTDQYLQWDSHHNLSAKFTNLVSLTPSPIGPKQCAAILSCSNGKKNISRRLSLNVDIPSGLWTKWRKGLTSPPVRPLIGLVTRVLTVPLLLPEKLKTKGHIVIPYTQGLCESFKKICGRYGIQTHFKGGSTIKNLLVSPKDKDPMVSQSDAIYWYQCGDLTCDDEYIGETSRTFGERYKEHLKDPSPIHHHNNQTNHPINQNNFKIIGRDGHHMSRYIKESIFIRVNNPTLNNNIGKFNLPHIWGRVLINTLGLKLNN